MDEIKRGKLEAEGENRINMENCYGKSERSGSGFNVGTGKPSLLLHSCCGPCSTSVIERLADDYELTVFFYNPNIDDKVEYKLRRDAQLEVIHRYNACSQIVNSIHFIEGKYDPVRFLELTEGLENEPEGGRRCSVCFRMRLAEAAKAALANGSDYFTTTLTVSPHKDYDIITAIGREMGEIYGVSYLDMDFKKRGGFQRSVELSKKWGLYRQRFCGCSFSKW